MRTDLVATRERLLSGQSRPSNELETSQAAAQSPACERAFISTCFAQARREAADPAAVAKPLAGLAVSVKDLFDVAGQVTAAGSRVLADAPAAGKDSPAVARLRAA